jgi:hypothetical protein
MGLAIVRPRARRLLQTTLSAIKRGDDHMKRSRIPPAKLTEWIEFCWLYVINPVFRSAPNKRKAYFEHRLGKIYNLPCF